eukprot:m.8569 g.8569  ORF g.8569 m.8569 type:complete len:80 (+) comp20714_c0_seq1:225-464(+)
MAVFMSRLCDSCGAAHSAVVEFYNTFIYLLSLGKRKRSAGNETQVIESRWKRATFTETCCGLNYCTKTQLSDFCDANGK